MANQYPCPDCSAVLKPKNPINPGQKVRCPKCQKVFVPLPKMDDEDDDSAGTYGIEQESAEEQEREKKSKQKSLSPLTDARPKSARGPAAAECTSPGNRILATASFMCVSAVISILVLLWPIIFHRSEKPKTDDELTPEAIAAQKGGPAKKADDTPAMGKGERFGRLFLCLLVLAYNGTIAYGAVKMLSLESYKWGMVAAGMTVFPLEYAMGYGALFWLEALADSMAFLGLLVFPLLLLVGWFIYVGATGILTLRKEIVVAGFSEKKPADV